MIMNNRSNRNQLSPGNPFPERGDQAYDVTVAQPRRNRIGSRSGERFSEWGLGWQEHISGSFYQGQDTARDGSAHQNYQAVIAAEGRELPGATNPPPTWDQVDGAMRGAFAQAVSPGEVGIRRHDVRTGSNSHNFAPTWPVAIGERQNPVVEVTQAPPSGGRGRRNVADVSDL